MTKSFCSQSGLLALLALFVVGGVLGPSVHRIHHAKELSTARADATCAHASHEGTAFEQLLPSVEGEPFCPFCVRSHFAEGIQQPSTFRPSRAVARGAFAEDVWPAAPRQLHLIRGPPASA